MTITILPNGSAFFINKTFLFVKIDSGIFLVSDLKFPETHSYSQPIEKLEINNICLNELKFCEVSQKPKPNRF